MWKEGQGSRVMSEDIEIDDIDISSVCSEPSASKMKASCAANYSAQEDIQLCESWENISTDPITGNEQPGEAYWKRIHDNYHANKKFESTRTANSLKHRWGIIYKEVQKFQGYFEEVEHRHPSGVSFQEHVLEAQTIYADKEPNKKGFTFNHCWLKVRKYAKFTAVPSSKRPRTSNSNSIDVLDQEDNDSGKCQTPESSLCSVKRPMGRKQAKGKVKKGGKEYKYAGMLEKLLIEKEKNREARWQEYKKMQERKASIEERKVAIKERKLMWEQEQKIIFSDVNTLDSNVKMVFTDDDDDDFFEQWWEEEESDDDDDLVVAMLILADAEQRERKKARRGSKALFSSKIFCKIDTVAFSFVFDKYCPIMD
ncbi:hypothetical protein BDA96_06G228800 [Sorghum bicolor]|nr:glutathione S-transferase T3 isoform X3 [Sorghum bicolor]KAG0527383.1 hypothetical protein BDA96_06G228800 [Sorghum bicolor]KXG27077.1 hypothetical protein SORBI_3006G209600 [Sorghum bicolor]|eukprot:XP_002447070.2 glutathione S-transferase T3 isoform X3 [Sorghum bicolor]